MVYTRSRSQREICLFLAQGTTRSIIAKRLNIRPDTVKAHIDAIYDKLGIHDQEALLNKIFDEAETPTGVPPGMSPVQDSVK